MGRRRSWWISGRTRSARPEAEGRELGDRVPDGSLAGSGTRSQAQMEGVLGSQRPARRAPTFAAATRPAGKYLQPAYPATSAARCPATMRACRLPACFKCRQYATVWRGQQRPAHA